MYLFDGFFEIYKSIADSNIDDLPEKSRIIYLKLKNWQDKCKETKSWHSPYDFNLANSANLTEIEIKYTSCSWLTNPDILSVKTNLDAMKFATKHKYINLYQFIVKNLQTTQDEKNEVFINALLNNHIEIANIIDHNLDIIDLYSVYKICMLGNAINSLEYLNDKYNIISVEDEKRRIMIIDSLKLLIDDTSDAPEALQYYIQKIDFNTNDENHLYEMLSLGELAYKRNTRIYGDMIYDKLQHLLKKRHKHIIENGIEYDVGYSAEQQEKMFCFQDLLYILQNYNVSYDEIYHLIAYSMCKLNVYHFTKELKNISLKPENNVEDSKLVSKIKHNPRGYKIDLSRMIILNEDKTINEECTKKIFEMLKITSEVIMVNCVYKRYDVDYHDKLVDFIDRKTITDERVTNIIINTMKERNPKYINKLYESKVISVQDIVSTINKFYEEYEETRYSTELIIKTLESIVNNKCIINLLQNVFESMIIKQNSPYVLEKIFRVFEVKFSDEFIENNMLNLSSAYIHEYAKLSYSKPLILRMKKMSKKYQNSYQ
jgi:hypothetical protein